MKVLVLGVGGMLGHKVFQELKANKRFAKFIDRVVFPCLVALKTTDPEGLLKELRKAGYMPMWEGNPMPTRERGMGTGYVDDNRARRRRRTE